MRTKRSPYETETSVPKRPRPARQAAEVERFVGYETETSVPKRARPARQAAEVERFVGQ
jgi:hypothetical protein